MRFAGLLTTFSLPVFVDDLVVGVVGIDVPVADLFHEVDFSSDSTASSYAFVVDGDG